jgi:hypothetical protein
MHPDLAVPSGFYCSGFKFPECENQGILDKKKLWTV